MRDGAVRISKGYLFFVSRRPPALAPSREVEVVADPSRTRARGAGPGDPARRAPAPRRPWPTLVARPRTRHGPRPRAGPQPCRGTAHAPRAGPPGGRQRPTARPRPHATPRPRAGPAGTQVCRNPRGTKRARGTSRGVTTPRGGQKTPTRATASRLIHGGHAHDFMRGRCTHLNNGTHQNNDQICSLDGHQNANMAQANTPVVRHGPGGAVTADATAHNYNVSRRTAIRIYGMASSAGSTLPASCHAGISSHAEHHEAHIHHRA